MQISIKSLSHVKLRRLLPAFSLVIDAVDGRASVRRRGFERVLAAGERLTLEPFETVDLMLDGTPMKPAACTLAFRSSACGAGEDALHQYIAQRVFLQPQHPWDATFLSSLLDMPAMKVQRTLFSQGCALTDLCRTQRLMRALVELMQGNVPSDALKRQVGWPDHGDLEAAFYDRFGVPLPSVRRLSNRAFSTEHRLVA